jgi:signal transduction histidine kinase
MRILLIEDNRADARLIQELLREANPAGFRLEFAEKLQQGIQLLKDNFPDVILLDLSLPDSQGLETFSQIHQNAPYVPVVVLSGLDDNAIALEAVRKGAQDYLVKGRVDGPMLARVMSYAIERKGTEERLRKTAENLTSSNRELDRFSRELKRANERLKKLDELKSNFISTASHELRTPLTSIKGYVSIVLQSKIGVLNDKQREFLGYVKESTDRLHRLLDELLDLSRIESGRVEMKMAKTDLAPLLHEEMMIFNVQAEAKQITIEPDIAENLPPVYCDPDKIRQVVDNLLSNAIKYTPSGGTITLSAKNWGSSVAIEIKDDGIGISEDDHVRIFEPFQRIHKKGYEGEEGVGLGLALVKRIVDLHRGSVSVSSEEDHGSVFSVTLPIEKRVEPERK